MLRDILAGTGYSEAYGFSFGNRELEQKFAPGIEPLPLANPLSADMSVLRTSLVPSMLRSIQWNLNRGVRDVQLFEIGKVYRKDGEYRRLILGATGALRPKGIHETERTFNFHDLKGDVEAIIERFNLDVGPASGHESAYYHPGRSACFGELAAFGELRQDLAEMLKLRQRIYVAEIDLEAMYRAGKRKVEYAAVGRFPSIRRDLSLLLDRTTKYADVLETVERSEIPELVRVEPFDRLEKGPFPESKYSLSISLIYQSNERTLTDAEIEGFDQRILRLLKENIGAQLRE